MLSTRKLVIAGNTLHFYHYNYPQKYGQKEENRKKTARKFKANSSEENISNDYRSEKAIKRIVQSNAGQYRNKNNIPCKAIFVTLTFKENVTELKIANRIYSKFIMRLNYYIGNSKNELKYLVVPEFQKLTRKAVHYHVIFFNLPYIENIYDEMKKIWGQGTVNVKTIYDTHHLTNYVVKYITKQERDERVFNQKKYFTSRNILRPIELREENLIELLSKQINQKPDFGKQFNSGTLITNYTCFTTTAEQNNIVKNLLEFLRSSPQWDYSHLLQYRQQMLLPM